MSVPSAPRNNPVKPPIRNNPKNPNAYNIGVSNEIDPPYIVATQLKTLMADGTATRNVRNENTTAAYVDCPVRNMWCAQTRNPITAIARLAAATKLYPNSFLRENVGISSLITPIDGRIMM